MESSKRDMTCADTRTVVEAKKGTSGEQALRIIKVNRTNNPSIDGWPIGSARG